MHDFVYSLTIIALLRNLKVLSPDSDESKNSDPPYKRLTEFGVEVVLSDVIIQGWVYVIQSSVVVYNLYKKTEKTISTWKQRKELQMKNCAYKRKIQTISGIKKRGKDLYEYELT